jgi:hypothetical protein
MELIVIKPIEPVNLLDNLPREILFEILVRLSLRSVIWTLATSNSLDDDTADYICGRSHKRDFAPTLNEIDSIRYKVKIDKVFPAPDGYRFTIRSVRYGSNASDTVRYYSSLRGLSAVSTKPWPHRLHSNATCESIHVQRYSKKYTRELIPGQLNLCREVSVRKGHVGGNELEFAVCEYRTRVNATD